MTRRSYRLSGLALAALVWVSQALATDFNSVRSGAWEDPGTWGTTVFPGPNDEDNVYIHAGHIVGAPADGMIQVRTLIVDGELRARYPVQEDGASFGIFAPGQLVGDPLTTPLPLDGTIINNGVIRAEDATGRAGGHVYIYCPNITNNGLLRAGDSDKLGGCLHVFSIPGFALGGYVPGQFINHGTARGGDGRDDGGGPATFIFAPPARPIPIIPPFVGKVFNDGLIRGGDGLAGGETAAGSAVFIHAREITNGSLIRGGDSPRTTAGSAGGAVFLVAAVSPLPPPPPGDYSTFTNLSGATVRGGNTVSTSAPGGSVTIIAIGFGVFEGPSVATNSAGASILGGNGCPAGDASFFGLSTVNAGTVRAGVSTCPPAAPPTRTVRADPPDGLFFGQTDIEADFVEMAAGSLLTIGPLANANAIQATHDLSIVLAPGGVLDLTALTPGTPWISAGGTLAIRADTVLLPPGAQLSDLVSSGAMSVDAGARYSYVATSPGFTMEADPGEMMMVPAVAVNLSNQPDTLAITLSDSLGWVVPVDELWDLDAIGAAMYEVNVEVPPDAQPGTATTVTLTVTSQATGQVATQQWVVRVGGAAQLLGDLDCDGVVDFNDITPFVLALSDPATYQAAYPDCYLLNADCNGDGDIGFDDINPFVAILSGGG